MCWFFRNCVIRLQISLNSKVTYKHNVSCILSFSSMKMSEQFEREGSNGDEIVQRWQEGDLLACDQWKQASLFSLITHGPSDQSFTKR